MLAPARFMLRGVVRPLADGRAGTMRTIREMRRMIRRGRVNPSVRATALQLVAMTPQRDALGEIGALFHYVRDDIRYVGDVLDTETLADAAQTLRTRAGDCDDKCILLASLLETIGYPTRLIVSAHSQADAFEHVYLQVACGGEWLSLDPTEPVPVGWQPPAPLLLHVETGNE